MYVHYLYHPDLKEPQRIVDPVGWDDLGKKISRDPAEHGVFFEYTPKLRFIKDGRKFLKFYKEKYGIEADVTFLRYKKNPSTRKLDLNYKGKVNMGSLSVDRLYAECNIEQTGFIQKLKNRKDDKVDLGSAVSQEGEDLTPITPITVKIPSKIIRKRFLRDKPFKQIRAWLPAVTYAIDEVVEDGSGYFKSLQNLNEGNLTTDTDWWTPASDAEVAAGYVQQSCTFQIDDAGEEWYITPSFDPSTLSLDEIETREVYGLNASDINPVDIRQYTFKLKDKGKFVFNFASRNVITYDTPLGLDTDLDLYLVYGRPGNYTTVVIGNSSDFSTSAHTIDGTHTVNLRKDDEVYIFYKFTSGATSSNNDIVFKEDIDMTVAGLTTNISITADTIFDPTNHSMLLLGDALMRTVESITDTPGSFRSNYYGRTDNGHDEDGEGSLRGVLNGKLTRGFPANTNPISTSLSELTRVCESVDGVGIGVERDGNAEYVVVEPLSYFYAKRRSIQLPYVRDLKTVGWPEGYFNKMSGGVDKWNNEMIGNLDEVNANREYTLPITQVKQLLELRCKYITSSYTIEALRRDPYTGSSSKDNDLDEDKVLIQLRRIDGGYAVELNEAFNVLSGMVSPETLVNAKLSPMRCLKRNGARIRSGLWRRDDYTINLAPGGGANKEMLSRLISETDVVNEKQIAVNKLARAIWIPELITFKYPLTDVELLTIEEDPYAYIEVAADSKSWIQGYLVNIQPDEKEKLTSFTLKRAFI